MSTTARRYDVVTFDCYGTLIDWEEGIWEAFRGAADDDGVTLDRDAVLTAYAEIEPIVEAEAYRPYRDVLEECARRVAGRLGWALAPARARFLPDSLPSWRPFADTNPVLERLAAAGLRLGILSNVDDDLLERTRRHFSVAFDAELVITAEKVRSYKPAAGHFLLARQRTGDARWLHAAQSWFHDIVPARRLGVPVVWVNRKADAPSGAERPDHETPTLAGLASWLLPNASDL